MQQTSLKLKAMHRLALFGGLMILSVALTGYALRPSQKPDERLLANSKSDEPLTESFFRETQIGQDVFAYLKCIDFECAEALKKIVNIGPDAVPPLVRVLKHGVPPKIAAELPSGNLTVLIRTRAIAALGELSDVRALAPLIEAVDDSSPVVRAGAAGALGKIGGDRALNTLLPLLRDPDDFVRETTATALGKLKKTEALPALRDAVSAELKEHVRKAMSAAIQSIEHRR